MNCKICDSSNTIKHHIDYSKNEVIDVCRSCHGKIHSDEKHIYYPKDPPHIIFKKVFSEKTNELKTKKLIKEKIIQLTKIQSQGYQRQMIRGWIEALHWVIE